MHIFTLPLGICARNCKQTYLHSWVSIADCDKYRSIPISEFSDYWGNNNGIALHLDLCSHNHHSEYTVPFNNVWDETNNVIIDTGSHWSQC